ncbi:MAG: Do family serine endopeptidase [Deltaproteobacteria bacterium]|nr:Do family serine endopeptidase [Deltaproteobacteria bacterium]
MKPIPLLVAALLLVPSACKGSSAPPSQPAPAAPAEEPRTGTLGNRPPAGATVPEGVGGSGELRPSLAPLIERVRSAVVGVTSHRRVSAPDELDDLLRRFFGDSPSGGPRRPQVETGLGSGFIIDAGKGFVLTNNHVVEGASEVLVRLSDEREVTAQVVGTDAATDIAVIRLKETRGLTAAPLGDSDQMRVGDFVVAIGNPFGLELTVTSGIISAKARVIGAGPYDDFLQTDAAINPGNSGGPLFDLEGNVVGINTAIVASGQGIGFAVPINLVKTLLPQLERTGKVVRGFLGVTVQDLTPDLARAMGLEQTSGALLSAVEPNGPAAKAGLASGDVVVALEGEPVKAAAELSRRVAALPPGQKVTVRYLRKGKASEAQATLGERPSRPSRRGEGPSPEESLGLSLGSVTPEMRRELGTDAGALVTDVQPGTRAARSGIRPGDVIVEANGQPVRSAQEFVAIARSARDKPVLVRVMREGSGFFAAIPGS